MSRARAFELFVQGRRVHGGLSIGLTPWCAGSPNSTAATPALPPAPHTTDGHQPPLLVALTGYGLPEDRKRALEAGFDVVKPYRRNGARQIALWDGD